MTEKIKWMYKQMDKKELYSEDMICGCLFWKLVHTDNGGYSENEIKIYWYKDGSISFSGDGEGAFIYFYPEQIKQLLMAFHNFKETKQ